MYDFDPDEIMHAETSEQMCDNLPIKEMHVILYKNLCGFITATYVWMELTEMIRIDDEALLAIMPPYGEC